MDALPTLRFVTRSGNLRKSPLNAIVAHCLPALAARVEGITRMPPPMAWCVSRRSVIIRCRALKTEVMIDQATTVLMPNALPSRMQVLVSI